MTRFASLLSRAVLVALLLASVLGGIARADDGVLNAFDPLQTADEQLPEDPGIQP